MNQGLWVGELEEERICRMCEKKVEDESHFRSRCREYKQLRYSTQAELGEEKRLGGR